MRDGARPLGWMSLRSARGAGGAASTSLRARGAEGAAALRGLRGQPPASREDSQAAPAVWRRELEIRGQKGERRKTGEFDPF